MQGTIDLAGDSQQWGPRATGLSPFPIAELRRQPSRAVHDRVVLAVFRPACARGSRSVCTTARQHVRPVLVGLTRTTTSWKYETKHAVFSSAGPVRSAASPSATIAPTLRRGKAPSPWTAAHSAQRKTVLGRCSRRRSDQLAIQHRNAPPNASTIYLSTNVIDCGRPEVSIELTTQMLAVVRFPWRPPQLTRLVRLSDHLPTRRLVAPEKNAAEA